MTPEQIQAMAKGLVEGQAIWYVLSACIGGAIAGFGTYLAEKGKNRATKEDIAAITLEVKKVEDVFNRGLADLNAHHQLRMVASERRLQAHQEAFDCWRLLYVGVNTGRYEVTQQYSIKCMQWLFGNYMFVEEKARADFSIAIVAANEMTSKDGVLLDPGQKDEVIQKLDAAQKSILEAVELPPMNRATFEVLAKVK